MANNSSIGENPELQGLGIVELQTALHAGDPQQLSALIDAGADIHYQREYRYNALLDAVHGRDVSRDPCLLELLALLIARRVNLSIISDYGESGLRVLSRIGRFDAVQLLLEAGADKRQLEWTPLMEAVAMGSLADVEAALRQGAALEARDWWSRTPWLIALLTGDIAKVKLIAAWGADTDARGRCGQPPLFYAVQSHSPTMVRWLLDNGADVNQKDESGATALIEAVDHHDLACVETLIEAGADLEADPYGTALYNADSREIILYLLNAGANPASLTYEGQRIILGLPPADTQPLNTISPDEFACSYTRHFGKNNPERQPVPYWEAMIRCGISAYGARQQFDKPYDVFREPVWCANRFGQSLTLLSDGRAIQIGGEHEDSYDPDFCIYNDVFVYELDGTISIYGYPESVFPPTDFHTATLIGDYLYIIGALGYYGSRRFGETPVYRLNIHTLQIERIETRGDAPGWISRHRATALGSSAIRIWEGIVIRDNDDKAADTNNPCTFLLDLEQQRWMRQ